MLFEKGLAVGQPPARAQRCALLLLLLLSYWFCSPGEQVENAVFQVSVSWVDLTQGTVPDSGHPSGFLQAQGATHRKWQIPGRCFVALGDWTWSFQKNLLIWERSECGEGTNRGLNNRLWALSLADNSTGHSLKLGGRAKGQQNMVNMGTRVWSRMAQFTSQPCHILPTSQACYVI